MLKNPIQFKSQFNSYGFLFFTLVFPPFGLSLVSNFPLFSRQLQFFALKTKVWHVTVKSISRNRGLLSLWVKIFFSWPALFSSCWCNLVSICKAAVGWRWWWVSRVLYSCQSVEFRLNQTLAANHRPNAGNGLAVFGVNNSTKPELK